MIAVLAVVKQSPRAVQCGGAEEIWITRDRIAGGITDRAVDTFDPRIGLGPVAFLRDDLLDRIVPRMRRVKDALCLGPFVEERVHIGGEVFDNG